METNGQKSYGAVVASIIIILVLIVGGLYFWGKTLNEKPTVQNIVATSTVVEATTSEVTNDDVNSLKSDLNLDKDLKDIDTGLKGI